MGGRKIFNHMSQKGFSQTVIIFTLVGLIIVGTVWYFVFGKKSTTESPAFTPIVNPILPTGTTPSPLTQPPPQNWTIYKNKQFGFSLQYPTDWKKIEGYQSGDSKNVIASIYPTGISEGGGLKVYYDSEVKASSVADLKEKVDARYLTEIRSMGYDEKSFLNRYKSAIRNVGGFEVVTAEGIPDAVGYDGLLVAWHVLLNSGYKLTLCCYMTSSSQPSEFNTFTIQVFESLRKSQ
ncbi:MAG: hypothetical protein Q7R89_02540 [bacterium]|nr:hypothetical protein [bacterium]